MIGGGDLRVYLEKIASITQWIIPTNVTKVRSFIGETQYFMKFIVIFYMVSTPFHVATAKGKRFNWDKKKKRI
jgi:hypothetical protein